jgi:hypothetical protein
MWQVGHTGTLEGCAFLHGRRCLKAGWLLQEPTLGEVDSFLQLENPRLQGAAGKGKLVPDTIEGQRVPSGQGLGPEAEPVC